MGHHIRRWHPHALPKIRRREGACSERACGREGHGAGEFRKQDTLGLAPAPVLIDSHSSFPKAVGRVPSWPPACLDTGCQDGVRLCLGRCGLFVCMGVPGPLLWPWETPPPSGKGPDPQHPGDLSHPHPASPSSCPGHSLCSLGCNSPHRALICSETSACQEALQQGSGVSVRLRAVRRPPCQPRHWPGLPGTH